MRYIAIEKSILQPMLGTAAPDRGFKCDLIGDTDQTDCRSVILKRKLASRTKRIKGFHETFL
jgi:hypothetical protein